MNIRNVAHKLWAEPEYFFGRFFVLRKLYSASRANNRSALAETSQESVIDVDVAQCVNDLRRDAVAFNLQLSDAQIKEIYDFACSQPLRSWGKHQDVTFHLEDLKDGRVNGKLMPIAEVQNKEQCYSLQAIANDPDILKVARTYLGYHDINKEVRLFWTFAGNMTDEERIQNNQTIEYHFDVHSWNFCYLHFYITDTNRENGAHEMVRGSHRKKPFTWLWGSAKKSDEDIRSYYPEEDILLIEATAGSGFFEDTSCYHRARAPKRDRRLLMQVRYF